MDNAELIQKFRKVNDSSYPDFKHYTSPLDRGLWILWVSKDEMDIKRLIAEQIVSVIQDVKEYKCTKQSLTKAFNGSSNKDRFVTYKEKGVTHYEIMIPGKKYLLSKVKKGLIEVFHFEPDTRYSSKRVLSKSILTCLNGEIKIVDPYCGVRTLDMLKEVKGKKVEFLTRLKNLKPSQQKKFVRELQDYKTENPDVEFRDYPNKDIHDRYIISSDSLVLLGHGLKDLGGKESFAVFLKHSSSKNVVDALLEVFNRRWKAATPI